MKHLVFKIVLMFMYGLPVLADQYVCTKDEVEAPLMRLQIGESGFENQVRELLHSLAPVIEKSVRESVVPTIELGPNSGVKCETEADTPKFDPATQCLYLPNAAIGKPSPLVTPLMSTPVILKIKGMKFNRFNLRNIQLQCDLNHNTPFCNISVDVPTFEMQASLQADDLKTNERLFSTISPLKIGLRSKSDIKATLEFRADIHFAGDGHPAIEIDSKSMRLNIPKAIVYSKIGNEYADLDSAYKEAIFERLALYLPSFPQSGTQLEKWAYVERLHDEKKDKEVIRLVDRAIVNVGADYLKIHLLKSFMGESDLLQSFYEQIWQKAKDTLGTLLTSLMQDHIPLKNNIKISLPLQPGQDLLNQERHMYLLSEVEKSLANLMEEVKGVDSAKDFQKFSKKIESLKKQFVSFVPLVEASHSSSIRNELNNFILGLDELHNYMGDLADLLESDDELSIRATPWFGAADQLLQGLKDKANEVAVKIAANIEAEEKTLYFRVHSIERAATPGRLNMMFTGCLPNTNYEEKPDLFSGVAVPTPRVQNHDFSAQVSLGLVNEYLKELHRKSYFDICITQQDTGPKVKDCKEVRDKGGSWQTFAPQKSPQIVYDAKNDKYILKIVNVVHTGAFLIDIPILRPCLEDVTDISINLNSAVGEGSQLFDKNSLQLEADVSGNFKRQFLCGVFMAPLGYAALGAIAGKVVGHTLLQQGILNYKDKDFAAMINNGLNALSYVNIQELHIRDGLLTIHGQFKFNKDNKE